MGRQRVQMHKLLECLKKLRLNPQNVIFGLRKFSSARFLITYHPKSCPVNRQIEVGFQSMWLFLTVGHDTAMTVV